MTGCELVHSKFQRKRSESLIDTLKYQVFTFVRTFQDMNFQTTTLYT